MSYIVRYFYQILILLFFIFLGKTSFTLTFKVHVFLLYGNSICMYTYRGSYINVDVLLNLLHKLGKKIRCEAFLNALQGYKCNIPFNI